MKRGLFLAALACAMPDAASAAERDDWPNVEVILAATDADAAVVEEVVRELLGRLPVRARFSRVASLEARDVLTPRDLPPSLARAWIDLRDSGRATLYLVDGAWEHVLVRHVPLPRGLDEIAREELGHILLGAVDALLAGERIGRPRAEVARVIAPSAPAPAPVAEPERTWRGVGAAAFYEGTALGSGAFLHGPGAWIAGAFGLGWALPSIRLSAAYRVPLSLERDDLTLGLQALALRLAVSVPFTLAGSVTVAPSVAAGADVVALDPSRAPGSEASPDRARSALVPFLRVGVETTVRLAGRLALTLGLLAEHDLERTRYLFRDGGETKVFFAPWWVHPGVFLAVSAEPR